MRFAGVDVIGRRTCCKLSAAHAKVIIPSAFATLQHVTVPDTLQTDRRGFSTGLFDRLTDRVSESVGALTKQVYFQDERMVTEPRRKLEVFRSMEATLGERVQAQRTTRQLLIPSDVKIDKTKTYMDLIWPREAVEAALALEARLNEKARTKAEQEYTTPSSEGEPVSPGSTKAPSLTLPSRLTPPPSTSDVKAPVLREALPADKPWLRTRGLAEYLRAYTTSTDGRYGNSPVTIYGRRGLTITDVHPIGNYALRICFSDGHNGGLYSYEYLFLLTSPGNKFGLMRDYIRELKEKRKSRDPPRRAPSQRRMAGKPIQKGEVEDRKVGRRPAGERRTREEAAGEGSHLAPAFPKR